MTARSIIDGAVVAIMASLQQAPAVCTSVNRTRLRPLATGIDEAIVVRPHGADPGETDLAQGLPTSWTAHIDVECYARADAGTAPDAAVDPLITAAYARLKSDPTLGGVVRMIACAGLAYEYDAEAEQVVCATFKFLVLLTAAPSVFTP